MPQAIPFAAAFAVSNTLSAVGASVAAQATVAAATASAVSAITPTVLVLGASYALAKLTAPRAPRPTEGNIERRDDLAPRFYSYGLVKVSGPVLLLEVNNTELLKITAFGARPLARMDAITIDGNAAPLSAGLSGSDGSFANWRSSGDEKGHAWTYLGTTTQAASAPLLAAFPPPAWTSAHQLKGIPYVFAELESASPATFTEAFPNGEPSFGCIGGVAVYDPRKDSTNGGSGSHRMDDPLTWEFSDNQRLCCLDWLTWADGYGKAWSRIDWSTWVPQIAMADDAIPLKAGGTEPRYRLATIVGLDEPRGRVLRRILDAGDQQLFLTRDGLIGSRGGVWQAPTVSIDQAQLMEAQFTHGIPVMDRINQFQLECMLPSHDYSEVELKPWSKTDDPDYLDGIVRRAPLQLFQVPSNGQAQRLAKIRMQKANPKWSGQLRTSFAALDALGEAAINLAFPELDIDGPFLVNGKIGFLADRTGMTLTVSSIDPTCYDWSAGEEQDAPPLPFDAAGAGGFLNDDTADPLLDDRDEEIFDEAA